MATEAASRYSPASVRRLKNAGWYVLLSLLSLIILLPLWSTLVRAVSSPLAYLAEVGQGGGWTLVEPDWGIFGRVMDEPDFRNAMALTFVVTILIVVGQIVTSILAAYAFAFLDFPLKRLMFGLVVATLLLPVEVTLIANLETVRDLGWINSYEGLTVPFIAWGFGIFLIRQAFLGVPSDLRDASRLDGFSHMRFLFTVAVPISRPIIGSAILISFLGAWNQYLWPRFAADNEDWYTIQVTLRTLAQREITELNFGFAAAALSAIPLLILLIVFQRQLVRGLTAGAVKG